MITFLAIVFWVMILVAFILLFLFGVHVNNLRKDSKKIESWDVLFGIILFSLSLIPMAIAAMSVVVGLTY